jgi:hypothetical protein
MALAARGVTQAVYPLAHHAHVVRSAQWPGLDGVGWQVVRQGGKLRVQPLSLHHDTLHAKRLQRLKIGLQCVA